MSVKSALLKFSGRNNPTCMPRWNLYSQSERTFCVSAQSRFFCSGEFRQKAGITIANKQLEQNRIISEAKKIVGYSTSHLKLKWIQGSEIINFGQHLGKLVGSNHPLLNIAENIIRNDHNMQPFGLIVLLISKTAGHLEFNHVGADKFAGILHSQRELAEVTEMIRTSSILHKGVINIVNDDEDFEKTSMNLGNKLSLLSGDYFLAQSAVELVGLRNQDVTWMMSDALDDLSQASFAVRRDKHNNPIPSIPPEDRAGYGIKEWTVLNTLSSGSLLGRSCQSALSLAEHNNAKQEEAYKFGVHLALAWQAYLDLALCANKDSTILYNLCTAPILFHIEHDSTILNELSKGLTSVENVDYLKVHEIVQTGPGIELTKDLIKEHREKATEILHIFDENDARRALSKIIAVLSDEE